MLLIRSSMEEEGGRERGREAGREEKKEDVGRCRQENKNSTPGTELNSVFVQFFPNRGFL